MKAVFKALEDIKKGDIVELDFSVRIISIHHDAKPELQSEEEANIIEDNNVLH